MATGVTVNEGKDVLLERILNDVDTNRTSFYMGLFTNAAGLIETSVLTDITELSGNGFAEVEIPYADWTVSSNGAGLGYKVTSPEITFTASGGNWTGITGAYIRSEGVADKLVHFCYSGSSVGVTDGDSYKVTAVISCTSGTNGIIPDEGAIDILNIAYKDSDLNSNPGYNLYCQLYTNTTGMDEEVVRADITEPTGGSYGEIKTGPTTSYTWTVSGGTATNAATVDFVASGSDYSANVVGYALVSNGTTRRVYSFDEYVSGPTDVNDGDTYSVDLT